MSATVVPHPPLLVPELAGAAAQETAELRDACRTAAGALASAASRWIAVGAAPFASRYGPTTCGTFGGFGADVRVALGPGATSGEPDRRLPLPLLVAGWLRAAIGADEVAIDGELLAAGTTPADAVARGREIADGDDPVAVLVLGDGAATHSATAPGGLDERAADYDLAVDTALRDGDSDALAGLDPVVADELGVGGRVPWQVLAGALGKPGEARVLHSSTPYGVAYHVALWTP